MQQASLDWSSVCGALQGAADWAGDQTSIIGSKVIGAALWFRFTESMDAEVLATINSIIAALMVVIFSQPENVRGAIIELKRSGRLTADPADVTRIAYNDAILITGWFCVISTLIMTLYRPGERADPILLVIASLITMIGCFFGTWHFVYRYVRLKTLGPEIDDHPGEGLRPPA